LLHRRERGPVSGRVCAKGRSRTWGPITNTISNARSLYRGITFGVRKRYSHQFQMEAHYTYSVDRDNDSNERDPFTFRYANIYNLNAEYSLNNKNNLNPLSSPALFDFSGFLRVGVGDPLQAQLALRFVF
jgi:hypothetical protein